MTTADKLYQACDSVQEKLVIWISLDTGLRVSKLCSLTPQNILWQQKSVRVSGKGSKWPKNLPRFKERHEAIAVCKELCKLQFAHRSEKVGKGELTVSISHI